MPLFTALSTFNNSPLEKKGKCTVCHKKHEAGAIVLWKSYKGKFSTCRVILCDENCHTEYDFNYWEARIDDGQSSETFAYAMNGAESL